MDILKVGSPINHVPKDVWKIILGMLAPHDSAAFLCVSKMTNNIFKLCEKNHIVEIARITNLSIKNQQKRCKTLRKYVLKHYLVCRKCGILLSEKKYGQSMNHIRICTGPTKKGTQRMGRRYRSQYHCFSPFWD